jgi:hypothetical protein
VLVGSGFMFFDPRLLLLRGGLESEARETIDCDRVLLSTVDDAVLPTRLRRAPRFSGAFCDMLSCFLGFPFGLLALLFELAA